MQSKKKAVLCGLLALCMFFSGICLEQMQADSFFGCAKKTAASANSIDLCWAEISEMTVCTAEMLGVRNAHASYIRHAAAGGAVKRAARQLILCMCAGITALLFFCFCTAAYEEQFPELRGMAVVLNYIHKTDGKK